MTIAVIFGGKSTEHDVSIITAISSVIKPLKMLGKHEIQLIYIAKNGAWYWDSKLADIELYTSGKIDEFLESNRPVSVKFDGGFTLQKSGVITGRSVTKKIDLVFPSMHGTNGEDGALMGLLEMAGVPYVGCGLESSVVSMNKHLAKVIATSAGLNTPKWLSFNHHEYDNDPEAISQQCKDLNFPLFVKPVHLGSSIGISRVTDNKELVNAIEVAFHYDDQILVEEGVENLIELTLPIMGDEDPILASLEMPNIKDGQLFDFETKYLQGGKKGGKSAKSGAQGYSVIPAPVSDAIAEKANNLGRSVYRALGCSGIARIDMLVDQKTEKVYFNEVNPLPGSLYSHNWRASGVSTIVLVEKLINLALKKHQNRQQKNTIFTTNYLKQF